MLAAPDCTIARRTAAGDWREPYNARMRVGVATVIVAALASGVGGAQGGLTVSVGGRAVQPGEVVMLTVRVPVAAEHVTARVFDRDVPAYRTDDLTWTALVGIDLDTRPGRYQAVVGAKSAGTTETLQATAALTVLSKRFSTRRLRVSPDFVDPPAAVTARILDEQARLSALWTLASDRGWSGPFVAPVKVPAVGRFGARSVFNGQPRAPHGGDDYPGPVGTPIVSPAGGRVVLAEDLYFTGNTVVVDHGLGLFSLFAHLSEIQAVKGDVVTAGQPIGLMGATGRVTGPHLHWAVRLGGARVDPSSLLAALGPTPAAKPRSTPGSSQ